jgi:hypothetical protein
MTKQEILFALDVTHPGGAPIKPGAAWETLSELSAAWVGIDSAPSLNAMQAAFAQHQEQERARLAGLQEKSAAKAALFNDLKTRLLDLGLSVSTPADLDGKIDQIIPAAKTRRESKTTTLTRLEELEKQVEMLTLFVVMLSRK